MWKGGGDVVVHAAMTHTIHNDYSLHQALRYYVGVLSRIKLLKPCSTNLVIHYD